MLGIGFWDWLAIGIYLVAVTVIGVWTVTRVKDTSDFFMAGRRFNRWYMMFYAFGAGTSGNDAVGVSSKTYTSGMSGIWYQWLWLFATPFYWLIAPIMRRMRCLTTGDYFAYRYDGSVEALYCVVGVLQLTVTTGVILRGGGAMIEAVSGGAISWEVSVVAMTVLFLAYSVAGGLTAAIVTDLIQGILTIVLSFMLLPVALKEVGYMTGLREKIDDPALFTIVSPGEINLFHIIMFGLVALIGIVTQPHILGVCAAGQTEMDGRFGFAMGNLLKRFCTVAWMIVGLCAIVLYPSVDNPDNVYGLVAKDLLPTVMPGLIGIFLAALLASIMDTCGAFMISSAGLFTENFYRRHLVPGREDGHYVFIGRAASVIIVVVSLAIAFTVTSVPVGLEWFFRIQALMGAAFWLGLFWRRTSVAGVWVGTLGALLVMWLTAWPSFHPWYAERLPEFMLWDGKFRTSWSMFFYLSAAFGLTALVSLVTPRVAEHRLERVFACLRTPVTGPEPPAEPFTLPPGVSPAPPNKLINHPDFEIPKPTAVGMWGFAFLWAWVIALIGFVYWLAGFGAPAGA